MFWYILKLLILLPLICGIAWGCMKLAQKLQEKAGIGGGSKSVKIIETTMLSPTLKLAVIEFHGREILVSVSRQGLSRLAEAPARPRPETPDAGEAA
ncbi:flagellar biosynthetic protein FliO [Novosphingobium album (ex Liu et al. 2023)]|uniref:Flagellar biosynthetic protein FliO n=1 Tax=Novosphingobium album (ex Liu et al. 2023) TaxID=3031130 RepID=A0ABT5WM54_9SPHN|nr:flagellar biosynthetic protein FliO [Novosphingobium album (ex Liu et al. 2023)]MDE8651126.1 flagellar biosynthetic protein FliO [Novosphingobium album (ex Liu et al. 2023)]